MGLATSLGPLVPACAAFRAGLGRPSPAPDFDTFFPGDEEPGTQSIHALGAATYGFSGVGRLIAILAEALVDLASRQDLSTLGPDTGLYVALPDPEARGFTTGKDASHEDPDTPSERVALLAERILSPAFDAVGLRGWDGPVSIFLGGHAGFAQALATADEHLRGRRVRSALVCSVDSLCGPATLELLQAQERLKSSDNPTGLTPGEAGAALFLEPVLHDVSVGAERPVFVRAVVQERDVTSFVEEGADPSDGRALASCVRTALGRFAPEASPPVLVSDHDGQHSRAHEWGMLRYLLAEGDPRFAECPAWMPAMSFGHTGVASGGLGIATALRALQRGYSPSPSILVLSSSDPGERAVIHLATE
ncbi:hypothetical protein OV208_34735 [Corallococcus sp. bb12-1]|uniref:hypothetical protein n=1 Tax=Corallococcus sp. bb12-1 TaxID=2996784 RepID=UPI00226DA506|nr:hypothetical protein [Corallococcus sp. bb12-1]MCY1046514.1 hypothetical protein [Corallococcus sp. bb12-1]